MSLCSSKNDKHTENLGSGFPLILNAWKQAGWGEPELKNRLEVDEVALVLPIQRFEGTAPKSAPKVPQKYQWVIDKKENQ